MRIRRRRRIKPFKPISKIKAYLYAFLIFLFLLLLSFVLINNALQPTLLIMASEKAEQLAKEAITDAITTELEEFNIDFNKMIKVEKDTNGKVRNLALEYQEQTKFMSEVTNQIKKNLEGFESNKVVGSIPSGAATGNSFLAGLGPDIPVTFIPLGNVKTRLDSRLKEAGINMVLVTVYIKVEVNLQIIIPFATEKITVVTEIPITDSLVVGDVPNYFYNDPNGKPVIPADPK